MIATTVTLPTKLLVVPHKSFFASNSRVEILLESWTFEIGFRKIRA